ncbi:MAG TPA: DUF3866 family protein [Firmicutes bacterium]|nr:DUF3866 family protein [Bacillota bacterium]
MIRIRRGKVLRIIERREGITIARVEVEGREETAVNYDSVTGPITPGQEVVLNTTAVRLGLGSGGMHFVMYAEGNDNIDPGPQGHIMKLRYTPYQVKCLCDEEQGSPHHKEVEEFDGLHGMPVVIGEIHSMLAPACSGLKVGTGGKARVAYLMTDGGALPIAFSKTVGVLLRHGLLDTTITAGHAFGGHHEAVNVHSGLVIARSVAKADAVVVSMGPGIAGTGTRYGFSGIEQGEVANAVLALGGTPVLIPRISFADSRERHRGVSHHTLTVLSEIVTGRSIVCVPRMREDYRREVLGQLEKHGIAARHEIVEQDGEPALKALEELGVELSTMGRDSVADREFFLASGAAGLYAATLLAGCPEDVSEKALPAAQEQSDRS